jgi:deoxyhypusine synthase
LRFWIDLGNWLLFSAFCFLVSAFCFLVSAFCPKGADGIFGKSLCFLYVSCSTIRIGTPRKWRLIEEVGIEVKDHAGFGLRHYRDIVVCCLLGFY